MAESRPNVPRETKRALIREAGGKCANPGCPNRLIELHHIQRWAVYRTHDAEHMIAVCPTCHENVERGSLLISDETLYEWKKIVRRKAAARGHIYVEPGDQAKLLLGSIAVSGEDASKTRQHAHERQHVPLAGNEHQPTATNRHSNHEHDRPTRRRRHGRSAAAAAALVSTLRPGADPPEAPPRPLRRQAPQRQSKPRMPPIDLRPLGLPLPPHPGLPLRDLPVELRLALRIRMVLHTTHPTPGDSRRIGSPPWTRQTRIGVRSRHTGTRRTLRVTPSAAARRSGPAGRWATENSPGSPSTPSSKPQSKARHDPPSRTPSAS